MLSILGKGIKQTATSVKCFIFSLNKKFCFDVKVEYTVAA